MRRYGRVSVGFILDNLIAMDYRARDKSHYTYRHTHTHTHTHVPKIIAQNGEIFSSRRDGAVWFTSHRRCIINRSARAGEHYQSHNGTPRCEISLRRYVLPAGLTVINGAKPFVVLNSGGQVSETRWRIAAVIRTSRMITCRVCRSRLGLPRNTRFLLLDGLTVRLLSLILEMYGKRNDGVGRAYSKTRVTRDRRRMQSQLSESPGLRRIRDSCAIFCARAGYPTCN